MCGRYDLGLPEGTCRLEEALGATASAALLTLDAGRDKCPGDDAAAMTAAGDELRLSVMRWGFSGQGSRLIINARAESVEQKPMFRELAAHQRCALPASRYYEWRRGDRQKFMIDMEDGALFCMAGLYRQGPQGREFVILTQPPLPAIAPIHNRMPMILASESDLRRWLNGEMPLFRDNGRLRVQAEGPEQLEMKF